MLLSHDQKTLSISVVARSSPLSQAQVQEVLTNLQKYHPHIDFKCTFIETTGDKNLKTSLRLLGKTNFFTREIDELQLSQQCRISIHSAKDLPEPIPAGLKIIALTECLNPHDVIVMRPGDKLSHLPTQAIIATSSLRRENVIRNLRSDICFVDIRGSIHQRLSQLEDRKVDGVVIAEAALIRLKLAHLNQMRLPGPTVPFQGQLAILARENDSEMENLFNCLDSLQQLKY
jgi:hydroxymethylbilane synthase